MQWKLARPPRILITETNSWSNKGDAAIVRSMNNTIRQFIPKARITILSRTPELDRPKFRKYLIDVLPSPLHSLQFASGYKAGGAARVASILQFAARTISFFFGALSGWPKHPAFKAYREADVVVSVGGGFMGGNKVGSIATILIPLFYAKFLHKPVMVYAQSIEPFTSKLVKKATRFVLNRVDVITVREKISFRVLEELNLRTPVIQAADIAFMLEEGSDELASQILVSKKIAKKFPGQPFVGITLRSWHFPGKINPKQLFENYLNVVAKAIEFLVESKNALILFVPQDTRDVTPLMVLGRLSDKARTNTVFLQGDFDPQEVKSLIGTMDIFIGTRMHSNIFALSMCVPVVAIEYEAKTRGIMEMLGLEKFILDINALSQQSVIEVLEEVWNKRRELSEHISKTLPEVRRLALRSTQLLVKLLDSST